MHFSECIILLKQSTMTIISCNDSYVNITAYLYNCKPKTTHSINNLHLADKFFCCFETQRNSPDTIPSDSIHLFLLTSPTSSISVGTWASPQLPTSVTSSPPTVMTLSILERDINSLFKRLNPSIAARPESVFRSTQRHCAD